MNQIGHPNNANTPASSPNPASAVAAAIAVWRFTHTFASRGTSGFARTSARVAGSSATARAASRCSIDAALRRLYRSTSSLRTMSCAYRHDHAATPPQANREQSPPLTWQSGPDLTKQAPMAIAPATAATMRARRASAVVCSRCPSV